MRRRKTSVNVVNPDEKPLNKAVFFNRDGTLNCDEGFDYIYRQEDVHFNPGVVEGLKNCRMLVIFSLSLQIREESPKAFIPMNKLKKYTIICVPNLLKTGSVSRGYTIVPIMKA